MTVGSRWRYSQSTPLGQIPRAKKRQKYDPGVLSAFVYPLSRDITQREGAAVWERYLSSRSPPLHLLYQIFQIVPVGGAASCLKVAGSTCGRAGRRLRRIIFLIFLPSALVVIMVCSVVRGTRSVEAEVEGSAVVSGAVDAAAGGGDCTSAMVKLERGFYWECL